MWENVIDFAPYSFMDCDALIYPFLQITEVTDEEASVEDVVEVETTISPNITSDYLRVEIENKKAKATNVDRYGSSGKDLANRGVGTGDNN